MRLFRQSIQIKIAVAFLLATLVATVSISVASYETSSNLVQEKAHGAFLSGVQQACESLSRGLKQIRKTTDYLFIEPIIKDALTAPAQDVYQRVRYEAEIMEVMRNFSISNLFEDVNFITLYGLNGNELTVKLDTDLMRIDHERVRASPAFAQALREKGRMIYAEANDGAVQLLNKDQAGSISVLRKIYGKDYLDPIGVMYLSINARAFDAMVGTEAQSDRLICMWTDRDLPVSTGAQSLDAATRAEIFKRFREGVEQIDFAFQGNAIVGYRIPDFGWKVVGVMPLEGLGWESLHIFKNNILVAAGSVGIAALLWLAISAQIIRPVRELTGIVKRVNEGDLSVHSAYRSEDELGVLSQSFNYMIDRINQLIGDLLAENSRKKDAEYRALQAQVNPHFLYNTLNSIRWMAILHKEESISKMVSSLSNLLRNSTNKIDEFIAVRQEFETLESYLYIQSITCAHKFSVHWDVDRALYGFQCIKFILQPIVENAIFHGIKPKDGPGTIKISLQRRQDALLFEVWDDGLGMTKEQSARLTCDDAQKTHGFTAIGVRNVHERIQMTYGKAYGVTIQSEPGRYTSVRIRIPAIAEGWETRDD